jgi:ribosome-binding protein aMBF1 (putative translation factor)
MWIPFENIEENLLKDPEIKQAYETKREEFEMVEELIKSRIAAGLTQEQLAEKMKTSQAAISRIESGRGSLSSIKKYAQATGKRVKITLV